MQFRWADFRLDVEGRTLERGGQPIRTQALAFDLLVLLLRHRGRVVSDAFVRSELWPNVRVSDASLRQVLKEARRAIGDDGRRQGSIETLRGRGLRWAVSVETDGGVEALYVGRDDVMAALERDLDETAAGGGGVTLLSGRPGIGKTSTLIEIAARADARGFRVLKAWARADAHADAYSLWSDVAGALGAEALTKASAEIPASGGISESNRFARFRTVENALLRSARERPLLLCFDDLQFADSESLALVRYVAPALRHAPARILGAHRPIAGADGHTRDLAALAAESATRVIELDGMDAGEIGALIRTRLGAALAESAAGTLAVQTGGSPLLALEVMRAMRASSSGIGEVSPQQIESKVAVGVIALVRRRLAAQHATTRRVLHAAAAIGDPFDPELVRAATGCAREALQQALLEAERSALIERDGENACRFAHPLFAEAVGEDLAAQGDGADAAMHMRVFEALESARSADAFRIATHALRASALLAPSLVVDRLRRASRAAWQMHAVADAEIWQRRAVEIAEAAALPPLELCDLLQELGELAVASLGINNARPAFDRAARIARDARDAKRLTSAALGFAHRTFTLDWQGPVLAWLRAAHEAPCGDAALEARVSARLGSELLISNPDDHSEAEQLMREGVERARASGDSLTLGRVLSDQSIATFSAADPPAALALAQEVAGCGRHAGDVEIEFRGLAEIATLRLELGDRGGLEDAFRDCESFVKRIPLPYGQGVTHGIDAMRGLIDGRNDEASAAMAAADRYGLATGSLGFGVIAGLQRFLLTRERGGLAMVVPALDQAAARFPNVIGLRAIGGLAHGLCGNATSAKDAADATLATLDRLAHDRTRLATLAVSAELAHLARSAPLAQALEPLLVPFAALHAVAGNAAAYLGSIAHALGFACAAQDRREDALRWFERALRAHEAMRSPVWSRSSSDAIAALRSHRRGVVRLVS